MNTKEIWKPILNHPGYEASSLGRIRSFHRRGSSRLFPKPKLLHPYQDKDGYCIFTSGGKCLFVHHAVLLAFTGPRRPGYAGLHRNDKPGDNRLKNLYWGTLKENWEDYRNGDNYKHLGSRHYNSKLTEEQVLKIRELHEKRGLGYRSISKRFPVSMYTIRDILRRKVWTHI